MSIRVGVLLSGCGFLDGSEIHESVLTLLHLDRAGCEAVCMAPRDAQMHVVDHATGKVADGQSRDMLVEAARIARGMVGDLGTARATDIDALMLPGGFGAAKNLCDFVVNGAKATAHPQVVRLLREVHAAGKPIGAVCIAPAVVAAVLGKEVHPLLTIGDDAGTAAALVAMGCRHQNSPVTGIVIDEKNRIVSTPAYMYKARPADVSTGIERLVQALVGMCSGERKQSRTAT
jgi:enhancing lycopene biosynthesis protein 2